MKFIIFNKKGIFSIFISIIAILVLLLCFFVLYNKNLNTIEMVMGGRLYKQFHEEIDEAEACKIVTEKRDVEKYFRPSKLPVLNDKQFKSNFFWKFDEEEPSKIILPYYLLKTPEDTIINYFSVLRNAANLIENKSGGCGTVGYAKLPYPVAYSFLSSTYRDRLDYNRYLKSFEGIAHINLIKLRRIPKDENHLNSICFFVEIETIEGSSKDVTYFAYYYGYVYISKEESVYKISNLKFYGEDFLCAPYHGWAHNAEASVDIRYGNWCSLVKERYPTEQDGYVKKIYFKGTDDNDYLIVFFQLTNDTDIEIAQYRKNADGKWELIRLDPNKCLEKD